MIEETVSSPWSHQASSDIYREEVNDNTNILNMFRDILPMFTKLTG